MKSQKKAIMGIFAALAVFGLLFTSCGDGNGSTPTVYTVTFDAEGGTPAPESPVTVDPDSTITQPTAMTKNYHTFGGWYTDSARTIPAVFPITVNGNVNLYAKWVVNPFTTIVDVTLFLNSLTNNTTVNPASLPLNIDLGDMTQENSNWRQLLTALGTTGKYVELDLSACTMNGTEFNPDSGGTGKDRIVSIVLPTVATSIKSGNIISTFSGFNNLKSISGAYVTTIGDRIFYASTNNNVLQNVDFPRATSIGNLAFRGCTGLQTANFPQVMSIGNTAFSSCTSLQSADFPQVESIGNVAFYNCTSLQNTNFPKATDIGESAFDRCTSLQSISLPQAESIGDGAFYGCTSLQTTNFPKATDIGEFAFDGCIGLQSISLPLIEHIGKAAFYGCTNLQTVTFLALAELEGNPFAGCTSITGFFLNGSGDLSVIENGKALVRDETILVAYPSVSGTVTLDAITSTVGDIATSSNYSFRRCGAFGGCTNLQSISLPQAESIGDYAFADCTSLQSLNIPLVTSIGDGVFRYTGNVALSITMGSAAPTLGSQIFTQEEAVTKTVIVKVPANATGYSPAPSPFTGPAVTVVSGNDENWANGFRGGGWDGTAWASDNGIFNINLDISLIIQQQ